VADYTALLAQRQASVDSDANRCVQILAKYRDVIDTYHGGMPPAWLAAIIMFESDGNATLVGDPSLGEYGLMQIAASTPATFGLPADTRYDVAGNVCVGVLEYSMEAALWVKEYPGLVQPGTADCWMLARLSFAVGRGGSRGLAKAASVSTPGDVYGDIARYVAANGGIALGSQSAAKVWFRVLAIPLQWKVAEVANGGSLYAGPPTIIPAPPSGPYLLPASVAGLFSEPASIATMVVAVGLAAAIYYLYKRRF
jgi:hypothetical protein